MQNDTPRWRSPAAWTPRSLVRRLVGQVRPARAEDPLPPPGERSGAGTDSLQPFLQHTRSTRPGPLE